MYVLYVLLTVNNNNFLPYPTKFNFSIYHIIYLLFIVLFVFSLWYCPFFVNTLNAFPYSAMNKQHL